MPGLCCMPTSLPLYCPCPIVYRAQVVSSQSLLRLRVSNKIIGFFFFIIFIIIIFDIIGINSSPSSNACLEREMSGPTPAC